MQTAKLQIGKTYAVNYAGDLQRFTATKIVTVRNAARSETAVYGTLDDRPRRDEAKYNVADIIGPFEEHAELAAKKVAEDAEKKARDAAQKKLRADVVEALGTVLKQEKTKPDPKAWRPEAKEGGYENLKADYSGVSIRDAVLPELLAFLTK